MKLRRISVSANGFSGFFWSKDSLALKPGGGAGTVSSVALRVHC